MSLDPVDPAVTADPAAALLRTATRDCAVLAGRIHDDIIQELAALIVSLGAAAANPDMGAAERATLHAKARAIQPCARLLAAVANQLLELEGFS